jgi:hypothetical protein
LFSFKLLDLATFQFLVAGIDLVKQFPLSQQTLTQTQVAFDGIVALATAFEQLQGISLEFFAVVLLHLTSPQHAFTL